MHYWTPGHFSAALVCVPALLAAQYLPQQSRVLCKFRREVIMPSTQSFVRVNDTFNHVHRILNPPLYPTLNSSKTRSQEKLWNPITHLPRIQPPKLEHIQSTHSSQDWKNYSDPSRTPNPPCIVELIKVRGSCSQHLRTYSRSLIHLAVH